MELSTFNNARYHIVVYYHGTDDTCRDGCVDSLFTAGAVHNVSHACDPSRKGTSECCEVMNHARQISSLVGRFK